MTKLRNFLLFIFWGKVQYATPPQNRKKNETKTMKKIYKVKKQKPKMTVIPRRQSRRIPKVPISRSLFPFTAEFLAILYLFVGTTRAAAGQT